MESLAYPMLIVEKGAEAWDVRYANTAMATILNGTVDLSGEIENVQQAEALQLDEAMTQLLDQHLSALNGVAATLHEIEISGALYHIYISGQGSCFTLLFIPIPDDALFDNITFHDLSESCNAIVVVLDETGLAVDMNECFVNLAGMSKDEAMGKAFFETFIPGDREQLQHYFEQILTTENYYQHFVTPFKSADAKSYKINWQVSKFIKNGHTYIIAVGSDISRFIEENSRLKQELKNITVGFEYFPLAVAYMNAEGEFIKMNPRFSRLFGIAEKSSRNHFDAVPFLAQKIGFEKMLEHIELIKELHYVFKHTAQGRPVRLKVDIRMLQGTQEFAKFYIVVVQRIK
jgi:PAS domain S-box-containing protein